MTGNSLRDYLEGILGWVMILVVLGLILMYGLALSHFFDLTYDLSRAVTAIVRYGKT